MLIIIVIFIVSPVSTSSPGISLELSCTTTLAVALTPFEASAVMMHSPLPIAVTRQL